MPHRRKQSKHCLAVGFKKGLKSPHKGKQLNFSPKQATKYSRVSLDTFNDRIHQHEGTLTFLDVDGTATTTAPLRPKRKVDTVVDDNLINDNPSVHPDLLTNKLMRPYHVQGLFATANAEHRLNHANCEGVMEFDAENSRKWGVVWQERLKCTKCKYISSYRKLYEEVENPSVRGRKAAKANVGLQLGLASTPISNTGVCRILNNANVISPSIGGMQKQTNKVCQKLQEINTENLQEIRQGLVGANTEIGQKNPQTVNVEGDSCYNNPMFNSDSTPFQAGTIATTTFCENNTKGKKIVGVHIASKLCVIGSKLRNKGLNVECPNHKGHCSANIAENAVIGNEGQWSENVARQINQDLKIHSYTGDGDSKSHAGVNRSQKSKVNSLKDIRHLANSVKREVYKTNFSSNMFNGTTKANLKNRFALSVKQRCVAELTKAHEKYNGKISKIKAVMPAVIKAIIMCFKGYCGTSCKQNSLVCSGNYRQAKNFMPSNVRLKMTEKDEIQLVQCISIILAPSSLEQTKLLTSTQKCEAVNRSYQAVNPKMITSPRNFAGRIHGQIHKLNNGYARSVLLKTSGLGASLAKGSKVIKQLLSTEKKTRYNSKPEVAAKRKASRYAARQRKYALHENKHYKKGLTDLKPGQDKIKHLTDHGYAAK